jgi:hypothetical protein
MRRWILQPLTVALLVLVSGLAEKNSLKTLGSRAPVVLSMSRLIVLGVACVWGYVAVRDGLGGWPAAFVGALVVIALPLTAALTRDPGKAVELAQTLFQRVGTGSGFDTWSGSTATSSSHGIGPSEGYTPPPGFNDAEMSLDESDEP